MEKREKMPRHTEEPEKEYFPFSLTNSYHSPFLVPTAFFSLILFFLQS